MAAADVLRKALMLAPALGLSLIVASNFEGMSNTAYPDPKTRGAPYTICVGHTGGVKLGQRASDDLCAQYLVQDVQTAQRAVDRLVKVPLSLGERTALQDFALNAGQGNLAKSSMVRLVNKGDRLGACRYYSEWDKNGLPGLVKRRKLERALCEAGVRGASETELQAIVASFK